VLHTTAGNAVVKVIAYDVIWLIEQVVHCAMGIIHRWMNILTQHFFVIRCRHRAVFYQTASPPYFLSVLTMRITNCVQVQRTLGFYLILYARNICARCERSMALLFENENLTIKFGNHGALFVRAVLLTLS
jgi:hypothetical protein